MNGDDSIFITEEINDLYSYRQRSFGLTKREFFSAVAMHSQISGSVGKFRSDADNIVAENSVQFADALIKELEKKK